MRWQSDMPARHNMRVMRILPLVGTPDDADMFWISMHALCGAQRISNHSTSLIARETSYTIGCVVSRSIHILFCAISVPRRVAAAADDDDGGGRNGSDLSKCFFHFASKHVPSVSPTKMPITCRWPCLSMQSVRVNRCDTILDADQQQQSGSVRTRVIGRGIFQANYTNNQEMLLSSTPGRWTVTCWSQINEEFFWCLSRSKLPTVFQGKLSAEECVITRDRIIWSIHRQFQAMKVESIINAWYRMRSTCCDQIGLIVVLLTSALVSWKQTFDGGQLLVLWLSR